MDWNILFITFGILFLGELGDKTQLIVFNLTLEYEKPYKVGIGATLGFAGIVTLGVFFGVVLTQFIPIPLIAFISGIVFIIVGILEYPQFKKLALERKKKKKDSENGIQSNKSELEIVSEKKSSILNKFKKNAYLSGIVFIFLMELGDKTQILTITLSSVYSSPLAVWLGSFFALITLAWMGVFLGAIIAKKVPKIYLKLVSMIIFISIGAITVITTLINQF
ncbi:hypothetical protein LCGC14_1228780 [marine sediment metagenome]|uniref:GDT1 family protein n=1 Tax=marine sediment metagenome TaxID=412755 RepID=A0A0F9LD66_9ZZZZ